MKKSSRAVLRSARIAGRAGMDVMSKAQRAARRLRSVTRLRPRLAVVLGSGFQGMLRSFKVDCEIPYSKLPGFPTASVAGHAGRFLCGRLQGTPMAVLAGRVHYYEGHDLRTVTFPIRTLAAFGVQDLLLTNAAGGIRRAFRVGDFMLLKDHINLMGANPLRGPASGGVSPFVDMTEAYDRALRAFLRRAARATGLTLHQGVYLAVGGPSYETPAEISAFSRLGADAVGMSTVPEIIVARQCGMRVAALSCITNLAAGRTGRPLSHAEVLQTGVLREKASAKLLSKFATFYGQENSS